MISDTDNISRAQTLREEGKIAHILGNHQKALDIYQEALKLDYNSAETLFLIGLILQTCGSEEQTIEVWKIAYTYKPDWEDLTLRLGRQLNKSGRYEEAVAILRDYVESHPDHTGATLELARALDGQCSQLYIQNDSPNESKLPARQIAEQAVAKYETAIALDPTSLKAWEPLWSLLFCMGELDKALEVARRYKQHQRQLAAEKGLDKSNTRFITSACAGNIGVISMMDIYVKAKVLGLQPNSHSILLVPSRVHVSNRAYLNYWSKYVDIIHDQETIRALEPKAEYLMDWVNWVVTLNDTEYYYSGAAAEVRRQWEERGGPALFTLSDEHRENGWKNLQAMGLPRDAWFVCLHVRDSGFKNDLAIDSFRNAEIESYYPAIQAITRAGGWVIRMGDPSMKPLKPMPNVIDYVHSNFYADWMDVFLSASCRFFVSTNSGLVGIAYAFGVPVVQTNFAPISALGLGSRELFIPKLYRRKADKQLLSFKEICSQPVSTIYYQYLFNELGIEEVANSPQQIHDVVVEMMQRSFNQEQYTNDDRLLQQSFNNLTHACKTVMGFGMNAKIGASFLQEYKSLL